MMLIGDAANGTVTGMLESLSNPQIRHAALVHLPIVVGVLGALGVGVLALTLGRSSMLRWCCVAVFALGALGGYLAEESGEDAVSELDTMSMTVDATEVLEEHERMGGRVWLLLIVTGGLVACTQMKPMPLRVAFLGLSLTASAATAGYVALTAHLGGSLVYHHGVGVPASPNNMPVGRVPVGVPAEAAAE